ncbi:MAG: PEP/pyruvate-binding domain-containing protein, partial [Candidatus ainarchaeum sp.]|nr:PEP/pyruvate-binding domain-containing protein [Candidatus ainarchaeum sp.]
MPYRTVLWFNEISAGNIGIVGGKGLNLGLMTNAGFPIPPGFVVTAQAYFDFLEQSGIKRKIVQEIDAIDSENTRQLETVSEKIRSLIRTAKMPPEIANEIKKNYLKLSERRIGFISSSEESFVAVRSSATAEDLPSISENEHVLVKINGKPSYQKIGALYEKVSDGSGYEIEVPGMKENKIAWLKVKSLFRHKADKNILFKIKTNTGREIIVSPNHSLIKLNEEELIPETVGISEIKKGSKLPVTAFVPEINCTEKISVLDFVKGKEVTESNSRIMIKNNSSNWKIQNSLPKEIAITEEFAYFLGQYVAEGSTYKNNSVSITNTNHKILAKIENTLRKLGVYKEAKINKHSVRAYCPSLVRFMHETCGRPLENKKGKGKLCYTKGVPDFVFGLSKKNIGAFLRGCFDGDGTIGKSEVSYSTVSEMLAGGIIKLLEILGINVYIRSKNCFVISIPLGETEKFSELVGFEDENKGAKLKKALQDYGARKKHPEFKYGLNISEKLAEKIMAKAQSNLPKELVEEQFCKNCGKKTEQTSYYKGKKRFFCQNCKKTFYEENIDCKQTEKYVYYDNEGHFAKGIVPWNYAHMQGKQSLNELKRKSRQYGLDNFFKILEGNVKWDEVKEILPVKYDGWVYDFVVPEEENFAAGLGGIITHNSASFAGQQETYLNVQGKDKVVEAVQKCWASLFTARAVYYRRKQNFSTEKVGIAVVVQKMIESTASGIMFTADPTGDETKIIIEAGFGLGEAIVSGSITPDNYVIDKNSMSIVEKRINFQEWKLVKRGKENFKQMLTETEGRKQKLEDSAILQYARIGMHIENYYKKPQDIEFAMEGKELFIVQSRAITTLGLKEKEGVEKDRKEKLKAVNAKILVSGLGASPGIVSGRVRIVPNVEDVEKVEKGDILVTKMTSPDWVPTMKKSIAIVTDAGGKTCFAGNTKVLTNKGIIQFEELFNRAEEGESFFALSLNKRTLKPEWKKINACLKRKAKTIKIAVSQTGKANENCLELTPSHKMMHLENRQIIEKEIKEIMDAGELVCSIDSIPVVSDASESNMKKAYLMGAIFTDGHMRLNKRRGLVGFIQKATPEKKEFIGAVVSYFKDLFNVELKAKERTYTSTIRGHTFTSTAMYYTCPQKAPAANMLESYEAIEEWVLRTDEENLLMFLAGVIDGDGSFNKNHGCRLHIYSSDEKLTKAIVLGCLRLGIQPTLQKNRETCLNIQIVEELEKLLKYTKRVKFNPREKKQGVKLFSAKQLLLDIVNEVNWGGIIKPYVEKNLLIDSKKVLERIVPMAKKEVQAELEKICNSPVRMKRAVHLEDCEETDVFNIEVDEYHNYVVFTEQFTPLWVANCHAAIISRELGIPCVVGTGKATEILEDNETVTVNGFDGVVYQGKVEIAAPESAEDHAPVFEKKEVDAIEKIMAKEIKKADNEKKKGKPEEKPFEKEKKISELEDEEEKGVAEELREEVVEHARNEVEEILEEYGDKKAEKMPEKELGEEEEKIAGVLRKTAVKVKVNVALPDAAESAAKTSADGVGLLRAEHMITAEGKHPAEYIREGKQEELVAVVKEGIKKVAVLFKGKPVWYRTFDARTDEFRHLEGGEKEPEEDNPMIGWHGIRRDLDEPELLKAQFFAIKQLLEEGIDNIGI